MIEIRNRFDALQSLDSAADWATFKEETLEAGRQTVIFRPRSGRNSLSAEILAALDESFAARMVEDRWRHSKLVKRSKGQVRADRDRVASELEKETEDCLNRNNF